MEKLHDTPDASVVPPSKHRMLTISAKTTRETSNNFAKGRCTFGERCKYTKNPQRRITIKDAAPPK
jgi:hypothetical protein